MRAFSKISADWWDYTTLDREILDAAARITIDNLKSFERHRKADCVCAGDPEGRCEPVV